HQKCRRHITLYLPLTSSLFTQAFTEIKVERLASNYTFTEGPAWSKDGFLIFSDTPTDRLLRWYPGRDIEVFRADANGPAGNAFAAEGRLYTCETRSRRVTPTDKKAAVEALSYKWVAKRSTAPHRSVGAKPGPAYSTGPPSGAQSAHRELDFYGVDHTPPKAPLKLVAKPTGRPNGIALSPNGRTLYVLNSDEHNLRV